MYIVTFFAIGHLFQDTKSFNINNIFPLTRVPKLIGAALIAGCHLKEGGTYFKVKGIVHIKFDNFVIFCYFLSQKLIIILYSLIYSRTISYFPYFSI